MQAAGAFASILAALNVFVNNMEYLSRFAAGVERLDGFAHGLARPRKARRSRHDRDGRGREPGLREVTLETPDYDRTLGEESLSQRGARQGLLIAGPERVRQEFAAARDGRIVGLRNRDADPAEARGSVVSAAESLHDSGDAARTAVLSESGARRFRRGAANSFKASEAAGPDRALRRVRFAFGLRQGTFGRREAAAGVRPRAVEPTELCAAGRSDERTGS